TLARTAVLSFFFYTPTASPAIYTLSLHDALPISPRARADRFRPRADAGRRHGEGRRGPRRGAPQDGGGREPVEARRRRVGDGRQDQPRRRSSRTRPRLGARPFVRGAGRAQAPERDRHDDAEAPRSRGRGPGPRGRASLAHGDGRRTAVRRGDGSARTPGRPTRGRPGPPPGTPLRTEV